MLDSGPPGRMRGDPSSPTPTAPSSPDAARSASAPCLALWAWRPRLAAAARMRSATWSRRWRSRAAGAPSRWSPAPSSSSPTCCAPRSPAPRRRPPTRGRARELRAEGLAIARRLELGGLLARHGSDGERDGLVAEAAVASALAPTAFYRRGDIWTIGQPGREIQLRDAKGLAHVARLLGAPHVEFHALDLVGGVTSERGREAAAVAVGAGIEVRARGESDAGPALDNQRRRPTAPASASCRRRSTRPSPSTIPSAPPARARSSSSSRASSPARSACTAATARPARTPSGRGSTSRAPSARP